jgi:hypothetical protein
MNLKVLATRCLTTRATMIIVPIVATAAEPSTLGNQVQVATKRKHPVDVRKATRRS